MTTPFPLPPSLPPTATLHYPATSPTSTPTILLFLPGNPGLINYYTRFLSTLSALHPTLTILGFSHAGFTPSPAPLNAPYSWRWGPPPYSLRTQVEIKRAIIEHVAEAFPGCKIVLMAHSMGAWLSLELLAGGVEGVVGGVMLFPAVMHIRESPRGRVLGPVLGRGLVQRVAGAAAWVLGWAPQWVVEGVVRGVTGQPEDAAKVTAEMVMSPGVVRQTLVMAAEEMVEVGEDRWEAEVWNAGVVAGKGDGDEKEGGGRGGMVFVFGVGDGWVAERTREEIMALGKGGARMVVEERGLPHGFCIDHGEEMAELCSGWLRDVLGEDV